MILFKYRVEIFPLYLPEASYNATGTMLALVAMYKNRMVCAIQDDIQCFRHLTGLDTDLPLVGGDVDLKVLDAIVIHETGIVGRNLLRDQSQYSLQFETLEKSIVFWLWIATSIHASRNHGSKVGGGKEWTEPIGTLLCEGGD
jgi:hypothetical protein